MDKPKMFFCVNKILFISLSVIFLQEADTFYVQNRYGGFEGDVVSEDTNVDDHFIIKPPVERVTTKSGFVNDYFSLDTVFSNELLTAKSPDDYQTKQEAGNNVNERVNPEFLNHQNWPLLNQAEHCGRSKMQTKSIGGRDADLAEYPWIARLIYRKIVESKEGEGEEEIEVDAFMCGGSMITKRYVLTAAHCCMDETNVKLAYVRLGEYDSHKTRDCRKGVCADRSVEVDVENFIKHSDYNTTTVFNDICLIRLTEDVKYTNYVLPICLPTSERLIEDEYIGKTMTVAGWGSIENYPQSRIPNVLQEVEVQIRPGENCSDFFKGRGPPFNWDVQICGGGSVGRNPCPGDSGGPLMYKDSTDDGNTYLMGVVSAGLLCSHMLSFSNSSYSVVFTRVTSYINWVLDTIEP